METAKDDFFSEFCWAVPKAFSDALAFCRFEQGDVLYDTAKAYEDTWGEAINHIKYSIQIKSPLRGGAVKTEKDQDSAFSDNWRQTVILDFTIFPNRTTKSITTTQGRVYTMLWHGDIRSIDWDTPEPSTPRQPQAALADLNLSLPWLLENYAKRLQHPFLFAFPFDPTRELHRAKLRNLQSCLTSDFSPKLIFSTPEDAHLPAADTYVPTLKVACFVMDTENVNDVVAQLKTALYVPAKDKKTETERFRIKKHGCTYPNIDPEKK